MSSDAEPPSIQCPVNIVAETDERRGTANVSWDVPTATDNSKEEVRYFTKQSVKYGGCNDFHYVYKILENSGKCPSFSNISKAGTKGCLKLNKKKI